MKLTIKDLRNIALSCLNRDCSNCEFSYYDREFEQYWCMLENHINEPPFNMLDHEEDYIETLSEDKLTDIEKKVLKKALVKIRLQRL